VPGFPSIKRKELWNSRENLKFEDWKTAAEKLGLPITKPESGSSHLCIRKAADPVDYSLKGLIATIYPGMHKIVHGKVFKEFLKNGFEEDEIWKALDKL